MRISNSAVQTFKACPRMYELRYIMGLEPVRKSEAIERGLAYHEALEHLLAGQQSLTLPAKIEAMTEAFKRYVYPSISGKVEAVEKWFEYKTQSGHTVVGRVDGLLTDGRVLEHKSTAGLVDGDYVSRLDFDEQIPTYMTAFKTDKVLYTVCAVPSIKLKKAEGIDEFRERCVRWYDDYTEQKITSFQVVKTADELRRFADEQDGMITLIENCKTFYRNPGNCMRGNRMCDYAPICLNADACQGIGFKEREVKDIGGTQINSGS